MKILVHCSFLVLLGAALPSCENPELARKRDAQQLEIARLKGELAVMEEKLKDVPPDRSEDLARVEQEADVQKQELAKIEAEVTALEAKKAALEKEYDDYKSKYTIR